MNVARAVACVAGVALLAASDGAQEVTALPGSVRVESGLLAGTIANGVAAFKGIPYAAPPVADARWRAPAPPLPWSGSRDASDYGPSCLQSSAPERVAPESRAATTSEDCLTLNVWTPLARPAGRAMPVMVWLHGGGNGSGTGADPYADGSVFARDGVVLVTLNYRLGLLGFFAHPALISEARDQPTANFGLLDQLAALRWVRANIAAFRGDPANVTLFGQSAGAEDAIVLAASRMSDGLFERVIAESPADLWGSWPTLAQAESRSVKAAQALGLTDQSTAAELRAIPADALARSPGDAQLGVIVDRNLVAAHPAADGLRGMRVPLIVGWNADDGSLLSRDEDASSLFPRLTADDLTFLRARYIARGMTSEHAVARKLFGDGFFAAPARYVAERAAASGQRAYLYRFDYVLSGLAYRRPAATHGSEIPFVFENWPPIDISATDRAVGAALHGCWIAFAVSGTPACGGAGPWPVYDSKSRLHLDFAAQPLVRSGEDDDVLSRLEERLTNP